jgi:two-component system chemotaxis response regulator CheY
MTLPGLDNIKVLLIDDHDLSRSLLRQILKDAGFAKVREAADGAAGLAIARHFLPEIICLDNQMPGKSGLEMLAEFKVAVPLSAVLMITASNDKDTVLACIKAGARGYILKPFSADTLVKLIEGTLAKQKAPLPGPASP